MIPTELSSISTGIDLATAVSGVTHRHGVDNTLPAALACRKYYNIYFTLFRPDYDVLSVSDGVETHMFHVDNHQVNLNKRPDMIVHSGCDNRSPVVAVSKFMHWPANLKIGLGDPDDLENSNHMIWEGLTKQGFTLAEYRWEWTFDPISGSSGHGHFPGRRGLLWKRTRATHVDGSYKAPSFVHNLRDYKLVDEQKNEVLAIMTSRCGTSQGRKRCIKIQINVDFGAQFDLMVLVTGLSLHERLRRRNYSAVHLARNVY